MTKTEAPMATMNAAGDLPAGSADSPRVKLLPPAPSATIVITAVSTCWNPDRRKKLRRGCMLTADLDQAAAGQSRKMPENWQGQAQTVDSLTALSRV